LRAKGDNLSIMERAQNAAVNILSRSVVNTATQTIIVGKGFGRSLGAYFAAFLLPS
jgi:hypothetical protein